MSNTPVRTKTTEFPDGSSVSVTLFDPDSKYADQGDTRKVFFHVKTYDPILGDKVLRIHSVDEAQELKRILSSFGL